jgi:L-lactate utilization protein LutC
MDNVTWEKIATGEMIANTAASLKKGNISVQILENKEEVLAMLKKVIPEGASVMTGGSTTLNEIGLTDLLKSGDHPWKNLKDDIMAEKDEKKQQELRMKSTLADYFLGSVHAVAETGQVVIASATGSQLPAYVFSSPNVIWIVGAQKLVADLETAVRRVREYVYYREDERMKKDGAPGTMMGKLLIFEKEFVPGRVQMIIIKEKLGF